MVLKESCNWIFLLDPHGKWSNFDNTQEQIYQIFRDVGLREGEKMIREKILLKIFKKRPS